MNAIRSSVLIVAGLAALSGCNREKTVTAKDESAESVAKKVAAANIRPRPGRWESSVKIEGFDIKGVPDQAKAAMQAQMGQAHTFATCLTAEQVNQPNGGFFQGGAKDCKYDHFTMAGGTVDAKMTCGAGMQKAAVTMNGSYAETSYDIKVNSQTELQPGTPLTMAMAITSRRTGDCNGSEMQPTP